MLLKTNFPDRMRKGYPLRIWGTAILLPAAALVIFMLSEGGGDLEMAYGCGFAVLVAGALFSLPSLFFNFRLCRRLAQSSLETATAKAYIIAAGFGFVAATFGIGILIWGEIDWNLLLLGIGGYGVSAAIGALLFPLRAEKHTETIINAPLS